MSRYKEFRGALNHLCTVADLREAEYRVACRSIALIKREIARTATSDAERGTWWHTATCRAFEGRSTELLIEIANEALFVPMNQYYTDRIRAALHTCLESLPACETMEREA